MERKNKKRKKDEENTVAFSHFAADKKTPPISSHEKIDPSNKKEEKEIIQLNFNLSSSSSKENDFETQQVKDLKTNLFLFDQIPEEWKNFPSSYESPNYALSNWGRIKNKNDGKILNYKIKAQVFNIHRASVDFSIKYVVAELFLPKPPSSKTYKYVKNLDGDQKNCKVWNLQWVQKKSMNIQKKKTQPEEYKYTPKDEKYYQERNGLPQGVSYNAKTQNYIACIYHKKTRIAKRFPTRGCTEEQKNEICQAAITWRKEKEYEKELLVENGTLKLKTKKKKTKDVRTDPFGNVLFSNMYYFPNAKQYQVAFKSLNLTKNFMVGKRTQEQAYKKALDFYYEHQQESSKKKSENLRKQSSIEWTLKIRKQNIENEYIYWKTNAENEGKIVLINLVNFKFLTTKSKCFWCNKQSSIQDRNGIDRLDSSSPKYCQLNSVSCCAGCNRIKGQLSTAGFFAHIRLILLNHDYNVINPPPTFSPQVINDVLFPTRDLFKRNRNHDNKIYDIDNEKVTLERYQKFRANSKHRNVDVQTGFTEFKNVVRSNCKYCNASPREVNVGLDRVNSLGTYEKSNVVPCCFPCNSLKGANAIAIFLPHLERILRVHNFSMIKK